ncbi:hypothetical protein [Paraburkholderia sp. 40]|uniref:hypothetical protein n=1 Tax=Paraburkholderia sp. 40 TaxID=2991059 RepID=UPI003D19CD87
MLAEAISRNAPKVRSPGISSFQADMVRKLHAESYPTWDISTNRDVLNAAQPIFFDAPDAKSIAVSKRQPLQPWRCPLRAVLPEALTRSPS